MRKIVVILLLGIMVSFPSCDLLQQAQKMTNLINCDFSLKNVESLNLAGVNVQGIQSLSSLNLLDMGKLTAALTGSTLPLNFTLNVQAKNPNPSAAGMNRLDWILYIDDIEMTKGTLNKKVNIPGNNGTSVIPMQMSVDLKKVLKNKTGDALLNFAMNLAGASGKPTRFLLKAKPTISVNGYALDYPGYINIKAQY
jgi:LEA14-like dessication related protein